MVKHKSLDGRFTFEISHSSPSSIHLLTNPHINKILVYIVEFVSCKSEPYP